jgi:uncharacterized SAM-binding protein YcdF (DUF218 family)
VAQRRFLKFSLILIPLALAAAIFCTPAVLTAFGTALVHDDGPAKADYAVVLAGDKYGNRILKGAELARQGYVPRVLVSGPGLFETYESDMAIAFAVYHGSAPQWFVSVRHHAESTREEAWQMLTALEQHNAHHFLLVTSDYHTARAARIFRKAIRDSNAGMDFRMVAAPDRWFRPDSWWKTREGRKIFITEWAKTVAEVFGL